MGSLPKATPISREDFPEQAAWIDRLLRPINQLGASTVAALPSSLALGGAELAVVFFPASWTFTTTGTVTESFPYFFAVPANAREVVVSKAEDLSADGTFSTAPFPTWVMSNDKSGLRVKIRHLSGLTTATKYRITFRVIF